MKKSLLIGIIGVGASMAAFGQGQIAFGNYYSSGQTTGIYFASGPDANNYVGKDQSVVVDLLYGASTDTQLSQLTSTFVTGATIQAVYNSSATIGSVPPDNEGLLNTYSVPINTLTGGTTYEFAYEVTATVNSLNYVGYSSLFQLTATASSSSPISSYIDHGSVALSPVPEPTTLALAGLGGAALLALRRKKA